MLSGHVLLLVIQQENGFKSEKTKDRIGDGIHCWGRYLYAKITSDQPYFPPGKNS